MNENKQLPWCYDYHQEAGIYDYSNRIKEGMLSKEENTTNNEETW